MFRAGWPGREGTRRAVVGSRRTKPSAATSTRIPDDRLSQEQEQSRSSATAERIDHFETVRPPVEALKATAAKRPALAVLDILHPGAMDGIESPVQLYRIL